MREEESARRIVAEKLGLPSSSSSSESASSEEASEMIKRARSIIEGY